MIEPRRRLRLGYLVVPLALASSFAWAKRLKDRHSPGLGQEALARISHEPLVHRGSESTKVLLRQSLASVERGSRMPTGCSATLFEFAPVAGRAVVAGFDGGAIT